MLKDIERKTIRIIANFLALRRRTPSINELMIKTGRSQEGVIEVLTCLAQYGFIEWSVDDPQRLILLEDDYDRMPVTARTSSVRGDWRTYGSK